MEIKILALHPTNSNRRDSKREELKRSTNHISNGETTTIDGFQDCANFRRRSMYEILRKLLLLKSFCLFI